MDEIIEAMTKDNLVEKLEAFWHLDMTDEEIDKVVNKINAICDEYPEDKGTIQLTVAKSLLNHSMYSSSPKTGGETNDKDNNDVGGNV